LVTIATVFFQRAPERDRRLGVVLVLIAKMRHCATLPAGISGSR